MMLKRVSIGNTIEIFLGNSVSYGYYETFFSI